jgi:hypothetical protein
MEGNLIDSSKYKISLLSLDSRFSSHRAHSNGEFKITLPHVMRNVMRIRMASAEIPFVEYEFSESHGNVTFAAKVGAATTYARCTPIPDGNYTAAGLLSAIQDSLQVIHSGFTCEFDTTTGLVTIENSSVTFSIFMASYDKGIAMRQSNWGIGYNLGFPKGILTAVPKTGAAGYEMIGVKPLTLQSSQYYLLQLECPDAVENVIHPTAESGFIGAFAKVILRENQFSYSFDDNANLVRKEFTFLSPVAIPFFTCRLLDAYGDVVDMQDTDWSLSIEVTEVTNSKTYGDLARTYGR